MPSEPFTASQSDLAVASEWLPSPTANSIGGVSGGTPYRVAKACGLPSAHSADTARSI